MVELSCVERRNKVTAASVKTMHQVRHYVSKCVYVSMCIVRSHIFFLSRVIAAAIRGDTKSALNVGRNEILDVVLRACAAKCTSQAILIRGVHAET